MRPRRFIDEVVDELPDLPIGALRHGTMAIGAVDREPAEPSRYREEAEPSQPVHDGWCIRGLA